MNVRAYTADESSGVDADIRGSYRGVIEKVMILGREKKTWTKYTILHFSVVKNSESLLACLR